MRHTVWLFVLCLTCSLCSGCKRTDATFQFGVTSPVHVAADVTVAFQGHGGTWPIGGVGPRGLKAVSDLPGPVPDAADVSWTDPSGKLHKQRVQITPLPPPTATSYVEDSRCIYFVIQADRTVKVMYHHPHFKG